MDPNHPPDPTQGTPTHPGPGQDRKSGKNRPKIDEKSIKSDFPAKSAEISEEIKKGGNVLDKSDAPKTNDRDDGNKTKTITKGSSSASGRGTATTPTTSTTTTPTSTAGTSTGTRSRPKTTGTEIKPTKSIKAKKGKRINSVIEDPNIDSNSEYSSTSEKEDYTNQARFGKMNKVIKELSKIPNSNLQGHPEVKASLRHNWGKEHETKPCAIDMYEKEEAARDLLAKYQTPSNKRPPESPTGATPEAKAAVHSSPGGTTQVRAETSLRSTVSTGNNAQMPKLTPPTGATSSPGGSGVSKEVGGGTGRGEHDSLPKRAPPSGEHTDTTQQRDGGHQKEAATKAAVNSPAILKRKAIVRLHSSNTFNTDWRLSQAVASRVVPRLHGGSGDTTGADGTGRREKSSLPTRTIPSGDHTETTQQRVGGQHQGVPAVSSVNFPANLRGMAIILQRQREQGVARQQNKRRPLNTIIKWDLFSNLI